MKKYGRLTVIEERDEKYLCKCKCGKIKEIRKYDILNGKTKSCGCLQRQKTSNANTKHGKRNERLYNIWCGMKQRCYNKNHVRYSRYGGRGITVCDEWKNDFKVFYDWAMLHGYADNLTIDRIDNNGNYTPSNCRWVDYKTQYENSVHSDEFLSHINHGT